MKAMFLLLISLFGFLAESQPPKMLSTTPVNDGEVLEFRLSYGWFTVGKAKWTTRVQNYRGDQCFKTQVNAGSSGLLGVFATVDDVWGEYSRTSDWLPKMTWMDLKEGKYTMDEKTHFDYSKKKITYDHIKRGNEKPTEIIEMDKERLGMLGGFLKMRSVDYNKYKKGETLLVEAFFEGQPYNLEVVYQGKEMVKSKVGRLYAHKVIPRLPDNRLFPGDDPITVWISADANQLPLRADARMSFGTAYVELTSYKNVKYGPDYN